MVRGAINRAATQHLKEHLMGHLPVIMVCFEVEHIQDEETYCVMYDIGFAGNAVRGLQQRFQWQQREWQHTDRSPGRVEF